jgi:16S rRNA (guanine527-N7)-methyltransferase
MTTIVGQDDVLRVSRETQAALEAFAGMLELWTRRINLIAPLSSERMWRRHIVDSAQLLDYCPPAATSWTDLGSGGGLPALVVAIIARDYAPDLRVTAVESDARKCAFMAEAARNAGVPLSIVNKRIEAAASTPSDIVSARALAPLPKLLGLARPWLKPDGVAILPKGARHAQEIAQAQRDWRFHLETQRSRTDPDAAVILIRSLQRASGE